MKTTVISLAAQLYKQEKKAYNGRNVMVMVMGMGIEIGIGKNEKAFNQNLY